MVQKELRNAWMVEMYKHGLTLQKIGEQYGLTRERVRQIVSRTGVTRKEGGKAVKAKANHVVQSMIHHQIRMERDSLRQKRHRKWVEEHLGDTIDVIHAAGLPSSRESMVCRSYTAIRFVRWYQHHETYLRYVDWAKVWEQSGHFDRVVGPEPGWCMIRKDKNLPWSVENAEIVRFGSWLAAGSKGTTKSTPKSAPKN